jgi:hypothetical protein
MEFGGGLLQKLWVAEEVGCGQGECFGCEVHAVFANPSASGGDGLP